MKSKNYILKHDFGYGRDFELEDDKLIKLKLRNFEDVKFYINWTLRDVLCVKINKQNIVSFFDSRTKTKVNIELLGLRYPWI